MTKTPKHPWDDANPEIVKSFLLRFPLPAKLKAEYVVNNSLNKEYSSLHDFCLKAINSQIEKELKKL
jgi:hypothetical protein